MEQRCVLRMLALPLIFLLLLLPALACGSSTTEKLSEASQGSTSSAEVSQAAQANSREPEQSGAQTSSRPQELSTAQAEKLRVVSVGFGQKDQEVGFAFLVENPNSSYSVENSQYQLVAYNAEGAVIKTESGYIELVLPNQRLGIAGTTFLDQGINVAKVELQLSKGNAVPAESLPAFTIGQVAYFDDDTFPFVTGIIGNLYSKDITNLRVSAVAYDDSGQIIGGGFTYLNFILANGSTGVKISLTSSPHIANIEIYPVLSGLSNLNVSDALPGGVAKPRLIKTGFGQRDQEASFAFLVNNPNPGHSIEDSQYRAVAFDSNNVVLTVEEGYIVVLVPNQTLGVASTFYVPEGANISRVDLQLKEGNFEQTEALPGFTSENITFIDSDFSDKVTGEVVSPYNKDVTNVRASAISYNEAGDIIGGGFTFIDFIPANGRTAAEVLVTVSATPTNSEGLAYRSMFACDTAAHG
jgi:hypothetical protein